MQEILGIELILHTERSSILPTETQLPSDDMKPTTECLHKVDRARSALKRQMGRLLMEGCPDLHGRTRLQLRRDGKRFLHLGRYAGRGNCMHDGLRFMTWWLRRRDGICRSRLCWFGSVWLQIQRRQARLNHRLRWRVGQYRRRWR